MTENLLERYNAARKKQGLPMFMKWTGTMEALQDAYNKLTGGNGEDKDPQPKTKRAKAPKVQVPDEKPTKKAEAPAPKKETPAKKVRAAQDTDPGPERSAKMKKRADRVMKVHEENKKAVIRSGLIPLSVICANVHTTGRLARIKLRAAYADGGKGLPKRPSGSWNFDPKDVKAIESLIRPKRA